MIIKSAWLEKLEEAAQVKRAKIDHGNEGQEEHPETAAASSSSAPSTAAPTHVLMREDTDPEVFREAVWGRVFNRRRDVSRVPRAVIRASSTAHVREAVHLGARLGRRVSVRSGGHSVRNP